MEIEIGTPRGTLIALDRFSYTKQVGDIGDIETSATNHTNSFTVRKDNESIRVLHGLSLPGSQSNVPYQKTPSKMVVDNYTIIENGWLQVESSGKSTFKLSILDGNVDFWKLIEGLSLGDIDLSDTVHDKTAANIVASFGNNYYKYILADYGGPENPDPNEWNGDFLVPSISEQYLFDRIFEHIQMDKVLSVPIDTWLTYPKDVYDAAGYLDAIEIDFDSFEIAPVQLSEKIQPEPDTVTGSAYATWDLPTYKTTIEEDGVYKISQSFTSILVKAVFRRYVTTPIGTITVAQYESFANGFAAIYVNDVFQSYLFYNDSEININLYENDKVELVFSYYTDTQHYPGVSPYSELAYLEYYRAVDYVLKIEKQNVIGISFADAFRDISVKDFIKNIMMRYSLTLFVEDNKAIFLTTEERITAPYKDLSNYVREKVSEDYIYPNYAVKNAFRHKYIDETDDLHDGYIYASENLTEDEKTLFESFTFARMPDDSMPVFEAKVKETGGVVQVEYKGVLGRFFSLGYKMFDPGGDTEIFTERVPATATHSGAVPIADFTMTTFRQLVPAFWQPVERLLTRSKIMKFELDLSLPKFMILDLKERVYLEQEGAFFLINKATIKDDGKVDIELIKIES